MRADSRLAAARSFLKPLRSPAQIVRTLKSFGFILVVSVGV